MKKIMVVFLALLFSSVSFAELKLVDGRDNVLASNVAGTWSVDMDLTNKLNGGIDPVDDFAKIQFTYTEDKKVLDVINARENGRSLKYEVYSVGKMTYTMPDEDLSQEYGYYAVINRNGNPTLAFFEPNKKDGKGDWEFANAMFAKGSRSKNDLLFIGGDQVYETMKAFKRVK